MYKMESDLTWDTVMSQKESYFLPGVILELRVS